MEPIVDPNPPVPKSQDPFRKFARTMPFVGWGVQASDGKLYPVFFTKMVSAHQHADLEAGDKVVTLKLKIIEESPS